MKKKKLISAVTIFCLMAIMLSGCATISKDTVHLSIVAESQTVQLQNSHVKFVQLYYQMLRDNVELFMREKWIPTFLSKTVRNEDFKKQLDEAYLISNLDLKDIEILIKGEPATSPYKEALISGVDQSVTAQRSRLGNVLIEFTKACQAEINKKREELIRPINQQERFVINEINASYAELQTAQSTTTAYLKSALNVKENQDLMLKKLGALNQSEQLMNTILDANDKLSDIVGEDKSADQIVKKYKAKISEVMEKINKAKNKYM